MTEPMAPWWREVREAADLVASLIGAAAARAGRDGRYTPPPGVPVPRRRRKAGSLRHLAEVIRAHRLAVGMSVDKDTVAGVLAGELRFLTDQTLVVAVVRAAHLISGDPFTDADAQRLAVACDRMVTLVEKATEADRRAPELLPAAWAAGDTPSTPPARRTETIVFEARVPDPPLLRRAWVRAAAAVMLVAGTFAWSSARPHAAVENDARPREPELLCRTGAAGTEIIDDSTAVFDDDQATRLSPTLDFDQMNGSARYARYRGVTYYWGRAGSDDATPAAGGARVRWRPAGGEWHTCPVLLPVTERGYVHTAAVATTIAGQPVTIQVCLWRDVPRRENCTPEIATG